ncbi:excisionase [Curtobacterium sp. MCPF17_031]|nr:excisionase [Curtobacterium sp. MCPF17_031]
MLLAIPDVQVRLAVSRATVYRLLDDNALASVSLGTARRVRESEVNRYIAALPAA